MPVNSFIIQPSANALRAAYRPIILKVAATATAGGIQPPFVSCDIYINSIYYKSIIRTAPDSLSETDSIYIFDIQTALQEYLAIDLAPVDNQNVLKSSHSSAKVFCRFRASDIVDSFTVEEGVKPVQGTKFTDPVSGDGLESNSFFVINSALQHEDNQDLSTHLDSYKQGTWADGAYPLTHRNNYFFCENDSDHFPFLYTGDCIEAELRLNYRKKGETSWNTEQVAGENPCDAIGFETEVSGNTVNVALDSAPTGGVYVKVQIKLQSDSVWTDKGNFTVQNFSFSVGEMGDYDIRVITFCSACDSSEPETGVFTIDVEATLAWRGIHPYCVTQETEDPVYVVFDLRNGATTSVYFPNEIAPMNYTVETKYDLYAKFYSDAAHLTPVSVTQVGLKVYAKIRQAQTVEPGSHDSINESVTVFTVDAAGVEVLCGNVTTAKTITNFSTYPTVSGSQDNVYTYTPYPTHLLESGNTGTKGFTDLEEYNTTTNASTGVTKPNIDTDPDYIAPASDGVTCPVGPPITVLTYGYSLQIAKVEIHYGSTFVYGETVADTDAGGYGYDYPIPKNINTNVTVKAKTLDSGNTTGILKVRITSVTGGVSSSAEFNIPDNIETLLPQVFQNIAAITISNY